MSLRLCCQAGNAKEFAAATEIIMLHRLVGFLTGWHSARKALPYTNEKRRPKL
jgi:hypothetical protein